MNKKKIIVAGTFDILHPGHIFLINEASKLGEVHVIIATDRNRERYSGTLPIVPEQQRLEVIQNLKNVKKAELGRKGEEILLTVLKINPDIILLGPDQRFDEKLLKEALKREGLTHIDVKRLNVYYDKYELNSSSLIKKKIIECNNGCNKQKKVKVNFPMNT